MPNEPEKYLNIGEVAAQTGLTLRALRFWEDKGLIHPLREKHHRYYTRGDVEKIKRFKALSTLGFTLKQIRLMETEHPVDVGRAVVRRCEEALTDLEAKRDAMTAAFNLLVAG